jgi:predicted transposase/invertase (TIGR01784 family)
VCYDVEIVVGAGMVAGKFLDPKNDFAFKKIFGTEKNKAILVHFLNDMLGFKQGEQVQNVTFLKTIQDPEIASKKQSIVDVLCTDEQGRQYIVEMQVARNEHFVKRAQYYAAKAYVDQMNNGDDYKKLKQIIFLAITDFVMFPDKKDYKSDHVILDKSSSSHDLKDFSFTFLELPKFKKTINQLSTMVEKWAYFFKHATHTQENEPALIAGEDVIIKQAYEVLNQYSWSEEERNTYNREKKNELDARELLNTARSEGRAEGRAEGVKEVAKNMLLQGMDVQLIAQITGLTKEQIMQA